jgi:hypothetical protein
MANKKTYTVTILEESSGTGTNFTLATAAAEPKAVAVKLLRAFKVVVSKFLGVEKS